AEERARHMQRPAPWSLTVDGGVWQEHGVIHRDEVHAGSTVVEHLHRAGYRKLLWLGPAEAVSEHYSVSERLRGVTETARRLGLPLEQMGHAPGGVWLTDPSFRKNLEQFICPELAIITYDVHEGLGIAGLAAQHGWQVGRDFGLACCDDDKLTLPGVMPQLSRVSYDRYEIGIRAADM